MADLNSCVLDVASWLPPREWAAAPDPLKRRLLGRAGELATRAKRRQIALGIGSDGQPLAKVARRSRRDHATGKPLDPHYGESRSVKWIRDSPGLKGGTVTLWWSHGFGRILGYHARGEVVGAYLRNIIEFYPTALKRLQQDVRHYWRVLLRTHAFVVT